ncbi:MAG: tautomerase family protein [Oscillospiraceae bacterium]|jgi:4-oxalocrotonate tautomerase family enzyme|nr:hypothetical protein [Oscillospiraceae bacterium]MDE6997268.1 tautomerase family protein [Oscillospiraceae bacterium]
MATIIGVTALELTREQQEALCAGVAKGVCDAFHLDINVSSMMLLPSLAEECHGPSAADQITYFIYTAPGKPDSQKRQLVKNVNEATVAVTGYQGKGKVIVIIKEHADNNVGVDGVLRLDAKKQAT